jgi:hypothetical protein
MPAVLGTCLVSEPMGMRAARDSTADTWSMDWMTRLESHSSGIQASRVLRVMVALLRAA